MQITEADRLDMLAELRRCHGERIGGIIVEHLPPAGWGDLARQIDISRLEQRIDASDLAHQADIARLEREIARLDGRINNLAGAMWAMGGIMTAGFMGLFTLIATKL